MQFLITAEFIDAGPQMPPEQMMGVLEQSILPSLEQLAAGMTAQQFSGGVFVGERAGVILMEADSIEAVNQFLIRLPFWGLHKWKVQPLVSWTTVAEHLRESIAQTRSMLPPPADSA